MKNWFFLSAWIFLFFVLALQHDAFAITNSYSFSSSSVSVEQGQTSSLDLVAVKTKDSGSNAELYVQILRPEGSKIDGSNPFFTSIKVNNIDVLSDTNFSTYIFFPVVADTYSTSSISIPITFSIKQSAPAGIYTVRLVGWYDSQTILATAQLIVKSTSSQTPTSTPKTTPSTSPTQSPTIQPPTTKPAKIFGTVASPIGNMPNLTMTLKDSSGTKTTKTDDSGDYRFDNVAPGKAKLTLTIPKGYFHANTGNAVGSSSKELVVESGGKYEKNWSLFSLEESKTGDTGKISTKPAKIFGTVASPIGNMPNLTMTLKDSSGTKTTKTDDSGDYRFDNVAPGKAKLTLTIPKGYFHANTGNAVGSSSKELVVESGGKYEKNWSLFSLEESKTGGTKNPKEKISPNTKPN